MTTLDQAKAFYECLVKNPKMLAHLESELGLGNVPPTKTVESTSADQVDRMEQTLLLVKERVEALLSVVQPRVKELPRQKELPLEGEAEEVL